MSQLKTIDAGFRDYQVKSVTANVVQASVGFDQVVEKVFVRNLGSEPATVRLNQLLNDQITILAGEGVDIPVKTKTVYYSSVNGTTLEIIGFME